MAILILPFPLPLLSQIPLGISIAAGVRIGNELGAGNPLKAKRSSYIAMAVVCKSHGHQSHVFMHLYLQSLIQ